MFIESLSSSCVYVIYLWELKMQHWFHFHRYVQKHTCTYEMFLNNIRTDEFLWFWPLDFIPYREMEWNLDFDGIEERQRDCGKDRNRGLPAMALIVNEFTSFLRRFVIRLNCVYGMEFMSCDSSFDLLCLSFFFFFLVLLSFESLFKRVILIDTAF